MHLKFWDVFVNKFLSIIYIIFGMSKEYFIYDNGKICTMTFKEAWIAHVINKWATKVSWIWTTRDYITHI